MVLGAKRKTRLRKGRGCPVGFMWGTALAMVFGEGRLRPELVEGAAAQGAGGCPRHGVAGLILEVGWLLC